MLSGDLGLHRIIITEKRPADIKQISLVTLGAYSGRTASTERRTRMDKWNTTPPEEDGAYLCTIEGQTMHGKFRYLNICNYENGAWDEKRVIAWMPMPDIYTEG